MSEPVLRGREAELGAVGGLFAGATSHRAGVLIVDGPPGIGKSRLLAEVARMAGRLSMRHLHATASDGTQMVPFSSLLAAVLGGDAPILDVEVVRELAGAPDLRYWLLEELHTALEASALELPTVVVLDDLHWADAGTLMALRTMVPRLAALPVLWVLAMRSDEGPPGLAELRSDLEEEGAQRLSLGALSEGAVASVVRDRLRAEPSPQLHELVAKARGNPFLLIELLAGLCEEDRVSMRDGKAHVRGDGLPARLAVSMRDRLARLSHGARQAVRGAAVLGRHFDIKQLAALLERKPSQLIDDLDEALRADLLVEAGERLAFRHDLIRQAVLETLPRALRRSLLREAATVMLAHGAEPAEVAAQLAESADVGDAHAIESLRDAARALSSSDAGVAADISLRALGLTPRADPGRGALVAETVVLLHAALRHEEATALAEAALDGLLPAEEEAEVRLSLSAMILRPSAARAEENRRALALTGLSPALRARHLAFLAFALSTGASVADGEAAVAPALSAAQVTGDRTALAVAMVARASLLSQRGRFGAALQVLDELAEVDGLDGTHLYARMAEFHRADALAAVGRLEDAMVLMRQGLVRAQRDRTSWLLSAWVGFGSHLRFAAGELGDARADAEALETMATADASASAAVAVGTLARFRIALHTEDRAQMARSVAGARELPTDVDVVARTNASWIFALKAMADGHAADAASLLRRGDGFFAAPVMPSDPTLQPHVARIAVAAGDAELAGQAVDVAERLASTNPGSAVLAGLAAHTRGIVDADVERLLQAIELLRGAQQPLAAASASEDAGAGLLGHRPGQALELLADAHGRYAAIGAISDTRRVARRLRQRGVPTPLVGPRRPETGWESLTESELRVVRVVGAGATNRIAAQQLFLSPHTVSSHLRHAFTKLEIRSRVELARIVVMSD